jgi:hypothetical protein
MSLFVCDECGCVENTALSLFWVREDGPALCSHCDPKIDGWHGMFDRRAYDPATDDAINRELRS